LNISLPEVSEVEVTGTFDLGCGLLGREEAETQKKSY